MCKYDVRTFCNFLKLNLIRSEEIVKIYNYIYIFSHFNQLICKLKTPSFLSGQVQHLSKKMAILTQ